MNRTIEELAANLGELEEVEAVVLAGSAATGLADESSDYDLYAYAHGMVPIEFRAKLLKPRAARLEKYSRDRSTISRMMSVHRLKQELKGGVL